ncbi:Zn-dependent hydrolase [Streptomyces sp. TRM66268-LWL]|uniref:Zn-dependent hydrolase n=1 Tax=Streptomyces polyasparticus TaxID=2767826 RepID=A0ABR7SXD0_9ACTN|nr:Zn-dependent hydrolase [Streptomyces polyasparticus]MBC9718913.1 Zn-dependent hydrolase [Streptomyces polyasparticus]
MTPNQSTAGLNVSAPTPAGPLRVDGPRLLQGLSDLARIGADPRGGITRPSFSPADREAVRWLRDWATEGGLHTEVDPAGNLLVRRPGRRHRLPVALMGSHLDTVHNAGHLDGAYGVLAAVETVRVLSAASAECRYEPVAVAFANEEGALFPQPFWGSRALMGETGDMSVDPVDNEGRSLREPLSLIGGDLDRVAEAAWHPADIVAYLELHIEQGPVLEQAGSRIGVVDAIVGRIVFDIELVGAAGHAGTTPMRGRKDPLAAAAQITLAVRETATRRRLCQRATVGRLEVSPNSTNVIPGTVRMTAEFRDGDADRLELLEKLLHREIPAIAEELGVHAVVQTSTRVRARVTDERLRAAVAEAADALGLNHMTVSSGAGHDAQIMAAQVPTGMIFVPSCHGLSHVPEEHTKDEDLVAGADVLLQTAANLAL